MVGFGESISSLIHQDSVWLSRTIAVIILLLLLGNYTQHLRKQFCTFIFTLNYLAVI